MSKPEKYGKQIFENILIHNPDQGGSVVEVTGAMGSAKSSVLLTIASDVMKRNPTDKIFWSNTFNSPVQFPKIGKGNYIILLEDKIITIHDRNKDSKEVNCGQVYFTDFKDLYTKAQPGKLNAVFFKDRARWIDFVHYLRGVNQWCYILVDEMAEIAPAQMPGGEWNEKMKSFSNDLAELRKCFVSLIYNTQSVSDIDYRVRHKVMIKVYLPGARKDHVSRVTQKAIDNLKEDHIKGNQAYIEQFGKFGKLRFTKIFKPNEKIQLEVRSNERKEQ